MIKKRVFRLTSIFMVVVFMLSFSVLPSYAAEPTTPDVGDITVEVPEANFSLPSYPMNTLTNENGVIFQFATSNQDGSVQNYYEWVFDKNVKGLGLKLGFWLHNDGYVLPFVFYTKIDTNIRCQPTLYKYSVSGKLVNSTSFFGAPFWVDGDFKLNSNWDGYYAGFTSEAYYLSSVKEFISPCVVNGTFYNSNKSFIGSNVTNIKVLNGSIIEDTIFLKSSCNSNNYYWDVFSNDVNPGANSPTFSKWWNDLNVTINGIAPVNPDLPNGGLTQEQINYNNYEINKINSNWLEKIYNKLSEIMTFLPELKGSGGGSDLTATNNAINEVGSKIDNIENAKPSEDVNTSEMSEYNQAEQDINDELESMQAANGGGEHGGGGIEFEMTGNAIEWIYNDVETNVKRNEKVFAVFLSILSMSLIMFILNKGANA